MSKKKKKRKRGSAGPRPSVPLKKVPAIDPSNLPELPVTYQALTDFYLGFGEANLFLLRKEAMLRIEKITGRPLICYVTKTHHLPGGHTAYIDHDDMMGLGDLIHSTEGHDLDVIIVSNGGGVEATERIVRLLRERFKTVRFILPANAYSAATLLCFSGDEIVMDSLATLGPIDPQINGIPARAILRAFESIEKRLKSEGIESLAAYMPLLSKYDLHILEICKSAQELSEELAKDWLSSYMFKCSGDDPTVTSITDFFACYDARKSHERSIDRGRARELGLRVTNLEENQDLRDLVRSLYNQYELCFNVTTFYKMFENARGINWGRYSRVITLQLPEQAGPEPNVPAPQPGPPEPTV